MTKKYVIIMEVLLLVAIVAAVSCTPKAEPATPADFYKGKSIEIVSTASPGIATDLILRIMASHLGGDTGTSTIVTTMKGASGMEGMNYLYKAKPDGLTLCVTSSVKFVGNKVFDEPVAEYEIEKFSYIMGIGHRLTHFFVSPEGPYQTVAELQTAKDLTLGATSPSGYFALANLSVIKILGLDAKVITGFDGVSALALAVKRGEITGYAVEISHENIEAGLIKPVFVLATKRDPRMPDVPPITELISLSDEDLELIRLWETALVNSSLFVAPPGLPENKLAFLRDLANQWAQDEGFRAEIDAVSGEEVQAYITGEEVNRTMQDTVSGLGKFQAIFADLIEKYRA
ncbi:Bug family tripartite tricarboxylate transporter substrate binding protein [Chloroflexota bacterium]